jgi:pimeloyl-ACP methyl ester carboxylesterase
VFTPTLTGVGERSHLLSPAVTLETHVNDVVNLIRWEELSDVVRCGHSYGGAVVTGVTDRLPDRVASLVYLDAFILDSGDSVATKVNGSIIDGCKV